MPTPRLAGITCVAAALIALSPNAEAAPTVVRLRIPDGIDPATMTVICGQYGRGLAVGPLDLQSDRREYQLKLSEGYNRLKLLLYAPGYRVVTADFDAPELPLAEPFAPRFEKLPRAALTLRLLRTNGEPVPNQQLTFSHGLATHQYFGYGDGMAFSATLATVTTDAKGEARLALPLLHRDPYFAGGKHPLSALSLSLGQRRGRDQQWDLSPSRLKVQDSYPRPVVITMIRRATLSGRIEASFLARHGIGSDDMKPSSNPYVAKTAHRVWLNARQPTGATFYNCMLMPDGTFHRRLPAGTYDLHIRVPGKGDESGRSIPVQEGVELKEGEQKLLVVK
jgi:hypothetical protein